MNTNDLKVIRQLMLHARTTWAELGTLLGLSAPAAADRVHKLEECGIIRGYTALIKPEAVGCHLGAYISITLDIPEQRNAFLNTASQLPEVLECHHIAGAEDYLLKIRCADAQDLEELISEKLKSVPGIKTRTTVILSTIKETPLLPIKVTRE